MAEKLSGLAKDLDAITKSLSTCMNSMSKLANEGNSPSSTIKSLSSALLNIEMARTQELKNQNMQLDIQKKAMDYLVNNRAQELADEKLLSAQLDNRKKLLDIQTKELSNQNLQLSVQKKFNDSLIKDHKQEIADEKLLGVQLSNNQKIIKSSHELDKQEGTIARTKGTQLLNIIRAQRIERNNELRQQRLMNEQVERYRTAWSRVTNVFTALKGLFSNLTKIVKTVFSAITKVFTAIGSGVTKVIKLFGNLANRIRDSFVKGFESGTLFTGVLGKIGDLTKTLYGHFNKLFSSFEAVFNDAHITNAQKLLSSIQTIDTIAKQGGLSNVTQDLIDFSNTLQSATGISSKSFIADMQEMSAVLYGLGMGSKNSLVGAKNLTMVSRYLAQLGYAGGDVETVQTKITSGIKGMTQSIDDLGLSVREAQMNAFLKNLKKQGGEFANITTVFEQLNEEQRVYVRYAAIIQQFTERFDLTDYIDQLNTVTGRVTKLKENLKELSFVIGNGLYKSLAVVAPYMTLFLHSLTGLIDIGLEKLVSGLNSIFGDAVNFSITADANKIGEATDDVTSGVSDLTDSVEELKEESEKAKGSLLGIDRLSVLSESGSKKNKGTDNFDYSSLMTDALVEFESKLKSIESSYFDSLSASWDNFLKRWRDKFIEFSKTLTGRNDLSFGFDFETIKNNLKSTLSHVVSVLKNSGLLVLDLSLRIADDFNIGSVITNLSTLLDKLTEVSDRISSVLSPVITDFYEKNLRPIVEKWGEKFNLTIDNWIIKLDNFARWFEENPDLVSKKLQDVFDVFMGNKKADGTSWLTSIASVLGGLRDVIKESLPILGEFGTWFLDFAKEEALPWLGETLREIAKWLKEHKNELVDLLKNLTTMTFEGLKIFTDLIGKIVNFAVEHPTAFTTIVASLAALKISGSFLKDLGLVDILLTKIALKGLGSAGAAGAGAAGATSTSAIASALTGGAITIGGTTATLGGMAVTAPHLLAFFAAGATAGAIGGHLGATGNASRNLSQKEWVDDIDDAREYKKVLSELHGEFQNLSAIAGNSFLNTTVITTDMMSLVSDNLETLKLEVGQNGAAIADDIYSIYEKAFNENRSLTDREVKEINSLLEDAKTTAVNTLVEEASEINTITKNMMETAKDDRLLQCQSALEIAATERDETIRLANAAYESQRLLNLKKLEDGEITKGEYDKIMAGWEETQRHLTQTANEEWEKQKKDLTSYYDVSEDLFGNNGKLRSVFGSFCSSVGSFFSDLGTKISDAWKDFWGFSDAVDNSNLTRKINNSDLIKNNATPQVSNLWGLRVAGYASGGSVSGGQLFVANEHGNPELIGNITGRSGVTDIANRNMITQAMSDAMELGISNGFVDVLNQQSAARPQRHVVDLQGGTVIINDELAAQEFARFIGPYLAKNASNFADFGFSI